MLAGNGLSVLRVFPLWPDFQPLTAQYGGGGKFRAWAQNDGPLQNPECVDLEMVARFRAFCDMAEARGLRLVVGMHGLSTDRGAAWNLRDQSELADVLTTHPYPLWTPHMNHEPFDTLRNGVHAAAQSLLYAGVSGRPCFPEEASDMGRNVCSEARAAGSVRAALFTSWACGLHAFLWWCAFDQVTHEPLAVECPVSICGRIGRVWLGAPVDGALALPPNGIVADGGPAGVCAAIAAAHSFDGAENLESWTVAASGNHPGSVLLSADGKSLYLSLVSPTVISFR